ncbi:MAG: hypothetical protein R3D33_14940 [Hyphomicrobiaceae bacterium]
MAQQQAADATIVVGESLDSFAARHPLAPVLTGLVLPVVFMLVLAPGALKSAEFVVVLSLVMVFVVAATIFVHSVLSPGRPIRATVDQTRRVLEIVRQGTFVQSQRTLAFADIAAFEIVYDTDRDGFSTAWPEITLRSGETVELPRGLGERELGLLERSIMNLVR